MLTRKTMTAMSVTALATAAVGVAAAGAAGSHRSSATVVADPNGALRFNKHQINIRRGTLTLHMQDPASSGLSHGIAIQGRGVKKIGRIVSPGSTSTISVKLKPGRYTFFCPVPGHRAAGMRGTLVVR